MCNLSTIIISKFNFNFILHKLISHSEHFYNLTNILNN